MKKLLTNPQIIERLTAAGVTIPNGNQTKATLSELAAANGVNIEGEEVPDEAPPVEVDDVSWRVAAGLDLAEAMKAAARQKAENEGTAE